MRKLNALIAGSTGYIGVQLIKILIKHKYVNICGYNDRSPLLMCAWEGHTECVRMLCEHPDITPSLTKKGKAGHSPLSKAKTAKIKKLIMDAINGNASAKVAYEFDEMKKKYGKGPLALAAKGNHLEDVKCLISGGEDVNQVANQGNTALIYASSHQTCPSHNSDRHFGISSFHNRMRYTQNQGQCH